MPPARDPIERFKEKYEVNESTGCWEWCASFTKAGYGQFGESHDDIMGAHVFSYKTFVGPIPDGYDVHHKCHNKACVNWNHLELILKALHGALHSPKKDKCVHGHEYAVTGFYQVRWRGKTWRQCSECARIKDRKLKRGRKYADVHIAASTG